MTNDWIPGLILIGGSIGWLLGMVLADWLWKRKERLADWLWKRKERKS